MHDPNIYYQEHYKIYQSEADALHKKMTLYSILRILVFLATITGIYFTFSNWQIAVGIAIFGILVFIVLLSKHTDIKTKRQLKLALTTINKTELDISSGLFHDRDQGLTFQDPLHFYSLDID